MSSDVPIQRCRIVGPERLEDRLLASGLLGESGEAVTLFYVLEVAKPWFPTSRLLPAVSEAITTHYPSLRPDNDLGTTFENLLKEVNLALNGVSESGETDWIGSLNGMILCIGGEQLHFSQTGRCPAYVLQRNRIRQITDEPADEHDTHPLKTFANLASGTLRPDDYLLVANQELYREISLDALRRIMNSSTPFQTCQSIVKELKRDKNPAVCAGVFHLLPTHDTPVAEPEYIALEEELESGFKRLRRRIVPVAAATRAGMEKAGVSGIQTVRTTHSLFKSHVIPAAQQLAQQGLSKGKEVTSALLAKKDAAAADYTSPVIEIITPTSAIPIQPAEPSIEAIPLAQPETSRGHWWQAPKERRFGALVLAVILIAAGGTYALSHIHHSKTVRTDADDQLLSEAQSEYDKAASAIELSQADMATTDIQVAQKDLTSLQATSPTQRTMANSLASKLGAQADILTHTTRLTPDTSYQLNGEGTALATGNGYLYALQANGLQWFKIGAGSGNSVTVPDSSDPLVAIAPNDDNIAPAFAYTRSNKLYRVVQTAQAANLDQIQLASGTFAPGNALASYNGNAYVLDGTSGLLWRYIDAGTAYGAGTSIIDATKYDLKNDISVAIDGSIYLLNQDGSIQKFTGEQPDASFALKNIPALSKQFLRPLQIFTNTTTTDLYVLDGGLTTGTSSTAKLIELTKDGDFVQEFGFPAAMTDVHGFAIDQTSKKLWLLDANTIQQYLLP